MSGKRLLSVPKTVRKGDATFIPPRVSGRAPLDSPLQLASFEGASFVDDWLAYATGKGDLVPLRAFMDWSEPPSGVLDAAGLPRYSSEITRGNALNGISLDGTDGAVLDADGVPRADVPWLRKLYLPAHDRFNIVGAELVCRQPTLPVLSRKRIKQVGVVVRRLALDSDGNSRLQDWVSVEKGRGRWVDLSRFQVFADSDPTVGRTLDPDNIGKSAALRDELGVDVDTVLRVSSTKGAVVAQPKGAPPCSVAWGVLSLVSSDQELADPPPATLDRFADELVDSLVADFQETALPLHLQISNSWLELAAPLMPSTDSGPVLGLLDADELVQKYFTALWTYAGTDTTSFGVWTAKAYSTVEQGVNALHRPFVRTTLDHALFERWQLLRPKLVSRAALSAMDRAMMLTLSAVILRRVRACRIQIIEAVYKKLDEAFSGGIDDLADVDEQVSASTLAVEIDNWIFAEENRDWMPRPWAPVDFSLLTHARTVHEKARQIERELVRIRERLSPAAAAYAQVLTEKKPGNSEFLISPFNFSAAHLDWDGLLEIGLLTWPTAHLTDADLDHLMASLRVKAADSNVTNIDVIVANEQKQLRPRFDSNHLYVAQIFARIAGTHACDTPQVVWSKPTEFFSIAAHGDLLGTKPVSFEAPNIPKILADIPKLARAGASPFAHILTPDGSAFITGDDPADTKRSWELAMICSFGIPVFTFIAMLLFKLIFSILIIIPGFVWMLLLKFCLPIPRRTS